MLAGDQFILPDETQEMDASIMYGFDRSAGAVASIKKIKNPIKLARKVLEEASNMLFCDWRRS